MGLPNTVNQLFNGGSPYYIVNRSLRFRASASAYLNRTPASASNQTTWTWSGWVKRGALGTNMAIFGAYTSSATYYDLQMQSDGTLAHYNQTASSTTAYLNTTQVFRDPSAWYHIVAVYNSTDATASNRMKLYVNGVQITAFSVATYPSQNTVATVNSTSAHYISYYGGNPYYFDGYLAEVNFIDGQALTPSSFGVYDSNGIWQPIRYAGTYGTNGFYLPFKNTTSTTTLVADASGNGNNWTANNISLTAGVTYDSMLDSPTVSNASSNYAVLNPLDKNASSTLSNANLTSASGAASWYGVRSSFAVTSGKWYWEVTAVSLGAGTSIMIGVANAAATLTYPGATTNGYGYYSDTSTGQKFNNGSGTIYGTAFVQGNVIGVAFDADGGTITFYVNGVSQGQAFSGITSGPYFPMVGNYNTTTAINFGQRPFTYTPPSGYNALNTANLPQPLISNGANYMAATTYTGNGSTQSISNGANTTINTTFQPDFIWVKYRNQAYNNDLFDSLRGVSKYLRSNTTQAELSYPGYGVTAINSNGFSVTDDSVGSYEVNGSGGSLVAWQWKAGAGTTSTNTSGSITSTVSVSAQSGFSIATYTGTGANATVGHGLGVAPNLMLVKARSTAGQNWLVYSSVLGATQYLILDLTNAAGTASTPWNNTAPTSSVFSIGTSAGSNNSGTTYVAYCFAAVRGYSAMGSYTGNGSSDGTFVFTNFRSRFVMLKRTDTTGNWFIFDTSRDTYNVTINELYPNLSNAEGVGTTDLDILSNGFKLRASSAGINASGGTYIYAAFAENPFQIARAR